MAEPEQARPDETPQTLGPAAIVDSEHWQNHLCYEQTEVGLGHEPGGGKLNLRQLEREFRSRIAKAPWCTVPTSVTPAHRDGILTGTRTQVRRIHGA
jgi:hypothetical protein